MASHSKPPIPTSRPSDLSLPKRSRTVTSPTTHSFQPSPVRTRHQPNQILYDIPLPLTPGMEGSVEGEGAVGSVEGDPLIVNGGNERAGAAAAAVAGNFYTTERRVGNATAYMNARNGVPQRGSTARSRSRAGSRELLETMQQPQAKGNQYGSRETLTSSTSQSTLSSTASPIKKTMNENSITTTGGTVIIPPPSLPRRRSSESSSRPGIQPYGSRRTTVATPPLRSHIYTPTLPPALPSRRTSPSPHRDLLSPGGSLMREAREGSLFTVGQQSVAGSYVRRDGGGVGSPSPGDLTTFAQQCQLYYFSTEPPSSAQKYIDSTLASLPSSHRAAYTRIQNSLRAQAHSYTTRLRLLAFHALISSTSTDGGLSPLARQDLRGARAREERRSKLSRFVQTWCQKGAVGVEPFFRGLLVCLILQGKGERGVGGAGGRRVVWEVDDAVYMEAGGKDFMNEAITIIKGVLGFEDVALSVPPTLRRPTLPSLQPKPSFMNTTPRTSFSTVPPGNEVEELVPLSSSVSNVSETSGGGNRSRAPSDPFIDPSKSPDKRMVAMIKQNGGKRGPAPPVHTHNRVANGRGPAPVPPASRSLQAPTPKPLLDRTNSDHLMSNPLSPGVDSPLLPGKSGGDTDSVIAGLEEAAEREDKLASLGRSARERLGLGLNRRMDSGTRSVSAMDTDGLLMGASTLDLNAEVALDVDDYDPDEDEQDLSAPRLRLWTFPAHISDTEIDGLVRLFPKHLTKAQGMRNVRLPLPRPTSLKAIKAHDVEAGLDGVASLEEDKWPCVMGVGVPPENTHGVVEPGTGRLWLGKSNRDSPWKRGAWARFTKWLRGLFGS